MLGGRGLSRSAVIGKAGSLRPVTSFVSARSLSHIATRPIPTVCRGAQARLGTNSSWRPIPISGHSLARFNSTSTATVSPITENAAQGTVTTTTSLDGVLPELSEIPEQIGYLKTLGLDYGWGPSSIMEWAIEHIHIWGGMPWWASIVAAGVLLRLALFKPSVTAAENAARTMPVQAQLSALRTERILYISQGNQLAAAKVEAQSEEIRKSLGISMWKSLIPLLQLPFGFGCFRVVRGMTNLPVPALAVEQAGWITDLTVYDPLYILPIATTAFMYYSLKKGADTGMNEMMRSNLGRGMIIGLPAMSLLFISWQPAALQMYFAATGLFGLVQAYLINTPSTRTLLGISPLPPRNSVSLDSRQAQLRMIQDKMTAVRTQLNTASETQASATKAQNISYLDKMINNTKQNFSSMTTGMSESLDNLRGGPKNHDGTPAPKPRLTDEERREAESYRLLREEEDNAIRNQRNEALRQSMFRKKEKNTSKTWRGVKEVTKKSTSKPDPKAKMRAKN
ncbi:putative mitochondrial export translocase Oxa1 [Talaromyces proteolyticus]|uniref:Mitochondrial export translocase Oxa1 n=1 Tax=Talaromyces proteolyticus TaxID=1131652 RepID=A0AAD4Q3X7_9EURO|nr:putative mitochondrial export translocase Oxa1 [Talaromyces proteolyticus]KAH8702171.1 putative mitochondrial export translocase Oxa1 [Talaromyces proteolyticus]